MFSCVALLCALLCVSFACERVPRNDSVAICCQYNTTFVVGDRNMSFVPFRHSVCGEWVEASGAQGINFAFIPCVAALAVSSLL